MPVGRSLAIRAAASVLAALFVSACAGSYSPRVTPTSPSYTAVSGLQHRIDTILASPDLDRGTWGILVRSASRNDTLFTLNANKLFRPASNMKIATLAAAADRLGWDFAYE